METRNTDEARTACPVRSIASRAALAVALTLTLAQAAHAEQVTLPAMPDDFRAPAGNKAFLVGHAVGTQNYVCLPVGGSFAYTLFTPQATLATANGRQLIHHFFGPNPAEKDVIRAAWQHSRDTSTVWAKLFVPPLTDSDFVAPGAIPWLLLEEAGTQEGPTGADTLTRTTFVHRVNTLGGVAPSTGCSAPADVGRTAFVPYAADYFFYKKAEDEK